MSPAAADTIIRHLKDTGKKVEDYDLIVTGDLGALVFNSYIVQKLKSGELSRVLFVATGALLSTVSSGQGESIPCIAHAVSFERVE